MKKLKNVNPNWVFGPDGLNVSLTELISGMFICNNVYFFERLKEFLKEFEDVRSIIPNDRMRERLEMGPYVFNKLFKDIVFKRFFNRKKPILLFLDGMKLKYYAIPSNESNYMNENHFFAFWHAMTHSSFFDNNEDSRISMGIKTPLEENRKYHVTYIMNEEGRNKIIHTTFEKKDKKWHFEASFEHYDISEHGLDVFVYLD